MKILFVASSGGHWEELLCLKELYEKYDSTFVTEQGSQAEERSWQKIYQLPQINRKEKWFVIHFIKLFVCAAKIIRHENPTVILTTGALVAFPFCLIGKLKGVKIVYIESFARVNKPSMTGRLCYPFADLFLIQWEELIKDYPRAVYVGGIF